jgi:hypothetical protein
VTEQPPPYPRQELLPQQVQPSRSRLPLLLVAAAVVVALVAGLIAWWALKDDGEQNRAAYCSALRSLMAGQGLDVLGQAAQGGGTAVPQVIDHIRDLAPGSVRSQWDDLIGVLQSVQTSQPGVAEGLRAFGDIQAITADANSGCGLHIQIPG